MTEPQTILDTYSRLRASGEAAILATLVDVKGSSYRLPGARMLIDRAGRSVGTISGGCLEADVAARAARVLETGAPQVITYDTTTDENSVFGFGMGCRGVIRVLLEPAHASESLDFLRECFERRRRGAIATLIGAPVDFPLPVGARYFFRDLSPDGEMRAASGESAIENADGGIRLENLASDAARLSATVGKTGGAARIYETSRGAVEFFLEIVAPPVSLLLFGAGFDALPVAAFAKNLGWRVTVVDHRAAWANADRFPGADALVVGRAEDLDAALFADENAVAVLMTHNYERDGEILRRLLPSPVRYVGALGPRARTERLLADIGENFDARALEKLHAPVGLDIGAETPEAIALAVVAEIQSVLSGRSGGFLKNRRGGIHGK